MSAFVASIVVLLIGVGICLYIGRRRPAGTPLTWGEAFIGSTFVFALMMVAYGIVPHQWLDFADNELLWRPDKLLLGLSGDGLKFGDDATALGGTGRILVSYQALRDIIVTVLYVVFMTVQLIIWASWQKRGRAKAAVEPTSRFGRPVIRKA